MAKYPLGPALLLASFLYTPEYISSARAAILTFEGGFICVSADTLADLSHRKQVSALCRRIYSELVCEQTGWK